MLQGQTSKKRAGTYRNNYHCHCASHGVSSTHVETLFNYLELQEGSGFTEKLKMSYLISAAVFSVRLLPSLSHSLK